MLAQPDRRPAGALSCALAIASILLALPLPAAEPGSSSSQDLLRYWPQWRGPLANGIAPLAHPPLQWSETNHVRWKIALPGKGHSSPIVFGDTVFLMMAIPVGPAQEPVYDHAPGTH